MAVACLSWWIAAPVVVAPWDVFTLLNGAYRIYGGEAPNSDYSNPIGPLVYIVAALGMRLNGAPSLQGVVYGDLLMLAATTACAWAAVRRRLPGPYAAAFTCFTALLAVSLRPLGYAPWTTTYALLYNRYSWLFYASLLLLVLLRPLKSARARGQILDGCLMGLLLGLLFYCKLTFFAAGVAAIFTGVFMSTLPLTVASALSAGLTFGAVAFSLRIAFGVRIQAYVHDFLATGGVQSASYRWSLFEHGIVYNGPVALAAVLVLIDLYVATHRLEKLTLPFVQLSMALAYVLVSGLLLTTGDADEGADIPAFVVMPLLMLNYMKVYRYRQPRLGVTARGRTTVLITLLVLGSLTACMGILTVPNIGGIAGSAVVQAFALLPALIFISIARSRRHRPRTLDGSSREKDGYTHLTGLLIGLLLLTGVPIAAKDGLSLVKGAASRAYVASPPATQRFNARALVGFVVPADSNWPTAYRSAHDVPAMINDGTDLLKRHVRHGDHVFTLGYTDPFSLALDLPPSRCGPLWWDLHFDFDERKYPTAECVLGEAKWVIIPVTKPDVGCCQETVVVMLSVYSGYLSQHFVEAEDSAQWTLLKRID